jgi:hypothetical protein
VPTNSELRAQYESLPSEQLIELNASSTLTDAATDVLVTVLKERGFSNDLLNQQTAKECQGPASSPDFSDPNVLREWRLQYLKTGAIFAAWFSIFGITAPVINVDAESYSTQFFLSVQLAVAVAIAPSLLFIRGLRVLFYPDTAAESPWAVRLGAIAACAYLTIVPRSLKLSLLNIHLRPSWIVISIAGTVVAMTYLWCAYKRWRSRSFVT